MFFENIEENAPWVYAFRMQCPNYFFNPSNQSSERVTPLQFSLYSLLAHYYLLLFLLADVPD